MASPFRLQASGARGRALIRLAVGVFAVASLAYSLAQVNRLPGSAGELLRTNIETDRDTTALFYTEVDGWDEWPSRAVEGAAVRP